MSKKKKLFLLLFFLISWVASLFGNVYLVAKNIELQSTNLQLQSVVNEKTTTQFLVEKLSPEVAPLGTETSIEIRITQYSSDPKATYEKEFYLVDEKRRLVAQLHLNDQGHGVDLTSGDEIFSGLYQFEKDGLYWVKTVFKEDAREIFSVIDWRSIRVLPFTIENSGNITLGPQEQETITFILKNKSNRSITLGAKLSSYPQRWTTQHDPIEVKLDSGSNREIKVPVSFKEERTCGEAYSVTLEVTLIENHHDSSLSDRPGTLSSHTNVYTIACE